MVREILDELARDVPDYTDPERALAAARRTRHRRTGTAVGAVAAVAALIVGVLVWPTPPDAHPPRPAASPAVIEVQDLPDGPLGRARVIYRPRCDPCFGIVVVLADGTEYRVHGGDWNVPSLSPDGRWLLTTSDHPRLYQLRDLTAEGSGSRPLPYDFHPSEWNPMTWSPDSRWLVMWGLHRDGTADEYARVDLRNRSVVTYRPPTGTDAIAVLPSGELVVASDAWEPPVTLRVVDPATGAERPLSPFATEGRLRNDPTLPAAVSTDGRLGLHIRDGTRVTGVLEVDAATGAVRNRVDLPADGTWLPVAYSGGRITVVDRKGRVGVLDPATGTVAEAFALPAPRGVLLPGGHTWY